MRVIAGSARRLQLRTAEGMDTRPTTDRIKETLFNMLQYELAETNFLDLFSGSGAMGIEALSRGSTLAVFIEQNPGAVACIRENLETTKLASKAMVMGCDVAAGLKRLEDKGIVFDIVFMDPPYNLSHEKAVLEKLETSDIINSDTTIIVEASLETDFSFAASYGFCITKEKLYKTNKHVFLNRLNG